MRDLDQGNDYEVMNENARMLRSHRNVAGSDGTTRKRTCLCYCNIVIVGLMLLAWILFLWLWVYTKTQGIGSCTTVVEDKVMNQSATLVRIPAELANVDGAFCLDGSVPSYYFKEGKGDGKRSWLVHLTGGGWCWNLTSCYLRTFKWLGSSTNRPPTLELTGVHSDDPNTNPDFYNWNVAMVNYCDGASFSGNVPYPVTYRNRTLFFRGALVLDLVIHYLVNSAGMGNADRIILTGESAGGNAVVLHIDHIATLIPPGIPLHGLADAAMFLDAKNMDNVQHFRGCSQRVFNMQQARGSLNKACLESADDAWRCFFTEYSYKYVKTPIFYVNSLYDYWGLWFILEMHCHPSQCPEQMSKFEEFHREYLDIAKQIRDHSTQNGMFVTSCYAHTQTINEGYWEYMIGGKTVQEAFGDWYFGRVAEGASFYFDCEDSYDCNPTCDWSLENYTEKRTLMIRNTVCVL